MLFHIPYGEGFIDLDAEGVTAETILPRSVGALDNLEDELSGKFKAPLDTPGLPELCHGVEKACIIVDDNTRPPTGRMVLKTLLPALRRYGVKKFEILIAIGIHAPVPPNEIGKLLGELPPEATVFNHDAEGDLQEALSIDGHPVKLNSRFMKAPLKIVVGDVELHQIFGYGGGAKSITPGISDKESLTYLHSFLTHADSGPGILEKNPVQRCLEEVYRKVPVDFSIQLVLDQNERPVSVWCGSLEGTFREAVALVDEIYRVKVPREFDIIVASLGGFPRDIDLYQTQKVINMTKRGLKPGGKMLLFSKCEGGLGPPDFRDWLEKGPTEEEVEALTREQFTMGLHKLHLFIEGIRGKHVYLHSELPDDSVKRTFLQPVDLEAAKEILQQGRNIGFVPYGTITLVEKAHSSEQEESAGRNGN
jgi:nickel-dependent lactate racemase